MIKIQNVSYKYPNSKELITASFQVKPGEFVYLTGPSGSGKSTILKLIYMEIKPKSGQVLVGKFNSTNIKSKHLPYLRRSIGIIFQDFKLLTDRTVFENIAFVLEVTGTRKRNIKKKVLRVLAEVGLIHKRNQKPLQLSGGEQQRIGVARALVNEPIVLLADEPTGNLDPKATSEIMSLLEKINIKGTAILMATHDESLLKEKRKIVNVKKGKSY